ncbi:hypothetical protein BXT86_01060 [candidate division WOR-3 bacterium 4484_100]|uniref:Cell division protein FtsL n=1 Tax=candidate division WOR-3 bacterium 4484_100 TaxID=1936077 RepID=A0A1V4QHH3_UNCW3|nr:MAG: hypothetical protein BXT86_01060 [candidate division WOR-3 bacterium 4484_100]
MRFFLILIIIFGYLFSLVYIESELVKLEVRKEKLSARLSELKNRKKELQFKLMKFSNLARIESEAKARGFIFPKKEDILGVVE